MHAISLRLSPPVLALCVAALAGCGGGGTPHLSRVDWDTSANWAKNERLATVDYEATAEKRFWRFWHNREFQGRTFKDASLHFMVRNTTREGLYSEGGRELLSLHVVADVIDDRGRLLCRDGYIGLHVPRDYDFREPLLPEGGSAEAYIDIGEIPEDSKRILVRIKSKASGWRPIYWTQGVPTSRPAAPVR